MSYRIYPNPAKETINLDIGVPKSGDATLTIYNAQGALQISQSYKVNEGNQSFSVNCNAWTTGLYFVQLKVNEDVVSERVLIER